MGYLAQTELERARFPSATRHVAIAVPIENLVGDAAEFDLEVRVAGVNGEARMAVGYLPGGPVTSGQQVIKDGETRVLRKQLVKRGSVLVIALDQPGRADIRVSGSHGFDEDAQADAIAGDDDGEDEALGADEPFDQVAKWTSAMNAAVKDLTELNQRYFIKVASSIDVGSGGSAKDAALGLHKTFIDAIDSLNGPQRQRVMSADPAYGFSRWAKNATELRNQIAGALGDASQWGLLGMLASVGGDTAEQLAELAKDAAPKVESNFHWLVVGVIALAVVVVFK